MLKRSEPALRLVSIASSTVKSAPFSPTLLYYNTRLLRMAGSTKVMEKAAQKAPRPVVLSGPSGCGKSTLINRLINDVGKDKLGFSVSHTTRNPRPGEQAAVDYHFVTREEFVKAVEGKEFVEHAVFSSEWF